jgi:hypothetical protein
MNRKDNNNDNIFKIFTGALKAWSIKQGETVTYKLRGIASGTALDAEGDRMSESTLRSMESQIIGLTLHKDHVFKVDNTLGHFVDAKVISGSDGNVRELWVEADLEPFDVNPDAKRVYEKIQSGTRLGFSIAGILKEWERIDSADSKGRFLVTGLELLSVDLVTVPAYRASLGSIDTIQDQIGSGEKSMNGLYICKDIGKLIRDFDTTESQLSTEPEDDISSRIDALEKRIDHLEKTATPEKTSAEDIQTPQETDIDIKNILDRICHIESRIVDPPKSKGLMVSKDGSISLEDDVSEAFEKGSGHLI